jgi:hypothetical protein
VAKAVGLFTSFALPFKAKQKSLAVVAQAQAAGSTFTRHYLTEVEEEQEEAYKFDRRYCFHSERMQLEVVEAVGRFRNSAAASSPLAAETAAMVGFAWIWPLAV